MSSWKMIIGLTVSLKYSGLVVRIGGRSAVFIDGILKDQFVPFYSDLSSNYRCLIV